MLEQQILTHMGQLIRQFDTDHQTPAANFLNLVEFSQLVDQISANFGGIPLAFAFRGILPKIVALGFLGITLLAFANLLTIFMKKGTTVPNRYGAAPTAFSFAR